ncbi:MAG TPA: 16S rRNA (adenine(1518)-N(6)/adenine(1519)-N(6))-dimethyltransferase RsmA [Candidatus Andersenbacteria bacterium]|nr:16S rRNA (adenine(1518)-N(6)/adenine(1519)-N(6))-dimethyltransferase RsmA [Candidatus Andersenbacteria bacterium]
MLKPLTNPDVLKQVLSSNKLRADKSLGQNFLICEEVIDAVLMALQDGPKKITELGPGLGTLTQGLITSGYHVRAIEKDDDFIRVIPSVLPKNLRGNLELIHGDLKDVAWFNTQPANWAGNEAYSLVGNIPYNLSGYIIRRLTKLQTSPSVAVFLMQKEVVDRMVATEQNMSLLGLSVGLWGSATLLLRVPQSCFIPQPAVQSALVLLQPNDSRLPVEKREEIIAKAKPFFQAKRKQIGTTMKRAYHKTDEEIDAITASINLSKQARPETISVDTWIRLCAIL